ncbi:hypothetical protein ACFYKX_06035 [Cytobacillus sp. FJAT-54145]|uniref:Transporter n=1 Tax=Cytobacillus spartinae TaxID=3299023 RepID=A0ABW6KA66_9BACI
MKKSLAIVMTGVISIGALTSIPVFAANVEEKSIVSEDAITESHKALNRGFHNSELIQEKALELGIEVEGKDTRTLVKEIKEVELKKTAEELGIETDEKDFKAIAKEVRERLVLEKAQELKILTEGKDTETLIKEIRETVLQNKANELGVETEGKSLRELAKEVQETEIKKQAEELGIKAEGKEIRELAEEVRNQKILNAAKELGIEASDKTTKELLQEILTDHKDKAEELGILPLKELFDKGFKGGKRGGGHKGFGWHEHQSELDQSTSESTKQTSESL